MGLNELLCKYCEKDGNREVSLQSVFNAIALEFIYYFEYLFWGSVIFIVSGLLISPSVYSMDDLTLLQFCISSFIGFGILGLLYIVYLVYEYCGKIKVAKCNRKE